MSKIPSNVAPLEAAASEGPSFLKYRERQITKVDSGL